MYLSCPSSVLLLCCCFIVERTVRPALRTIMRKIGSISSVRESITLISNPRSSGTLDYLNIINLNFLHMFYLNFDANNEGRKRLSLKRKEKRKGDSPV